MKTFTLIANNCWGAEVYKELGLPYSTPVVGLFIPPESYLKLLSNLPFYLKQPLTFIDKSIFEIYNLYREANKSNYPIAELTNGIEIHFLHYQSTLEEQQKWDKRVKRVNLNPDNLFVKFCDREVENQTLFEIFDALPIKNKVVFSVKKLQNIRSAIWIFEQRNLKEVTDGKNLYDVSKSYFDVIKWIKTGNGNLSFKKIVTLNCFLIKNILLSVFQKLAKFNN